MQGSAGYVAGCLAGRRAEVAYLGVGQLGVQPEEYLRAYWAETVGAVGARRVVLTHWDDFFRPLDQPLRRCRTPATTSTSPCGSSTGSPANGVCAALPDGVAARGPLGLIGRADRPA